MILGLTGTLASGKDTVADFLIKHHGFARDSLSDIIRDEAERRGLSLERDTLVKLGNELRHTHGADYLADQAVKRWQAKGSPPTVIVSLRHPAEVERFHREPGFHLIAVDAPIAMRYERLRQRGRVGDTITLEQFQAQEAREYEHPDPLHQQLRQTIALADSTIMNDGRLEALYAKVQAILEVFSPTSVEPL